MDEKSSPKKTITEEIFAQMKEKIVQGEWKAGDRLPTEKELMQMFQVSRISVREPIKQLASLGLLETRQGSGTYVRAFNADAFVSGMTPMLSGGAITRRELLHILEVRKIEVMITGLAAEKAEMGGIQKLQDIYDEMLANSDNPEILARTDLEFHLQISNMAENPYLLQIMRMLYDALAQAMRSIILIMGSRGALYYHAKLIDTISRHYVHEAQALMAEHLKENVRAVMSMPEDAELFAKPVE